MANTTDPMSQALRSPIDGASKGFFALIAPLVVAMVAVSWTWVPSMRGILADFGGSPAPFTQVVLSGWWLPGWTALVLCLALFAGLFARHRPTRVTLLASALAVGLTAIVLTWWGGQLLPLTDLATSIEAD